MLHLMKNKGLSHSLWKRADIHRNCRSASIAVQRPAGLRIGWSSDIVNSTVPYTSQILATRGKSFDNIAVAYCHPHQLKVDEHGIGQRSVEDSWLEIILPFGDHKGLRESMVRSDGRTILHGKLLEILDALAADVGYRHAVTAAEEVNEDNDLTIVTACLDGMRQFSTIGVDDDLRLQGYMSYTGKSSMEISIDLVSIPHNASEKLCGTMQFVMVARRNDKAARVHSLVPLTDEEKQRFEDGKRRAAARRSKSQNSLAVAPPLPDETEFIHALYLNSRMLKAQKNDFLTKMRLQSGGEMGMGGIGQKELDLASLLFAPPTGQGVTTDTGLAVPNFQKMKWMKDTVYKSVLNMAPQSRNVHGKIFGGFIMNTAFELGWVTAMRYFGGTGTPRFFSAEDIEFLKPVSIGSIMEFTAGVIYSNDDKIVIQVKANDIDIVTGIRSVTNVLTFVYEARPYSNSLPITPSGIADANTSENRIPSHPTPHTVSDIPQVIPSEYQEFVLYLEGKRCLDGILADV